MSDVEKFYYSIQKHIGGNVNWNSPNPQDQLRFINSINTILQVCSAKNI